MTTTKSEVDEGAVETFGGRLMGLYTGGMLTYMIDIGHRTGLFSTLAEGAGTSADLAARAGLDERYVREWLGAMTTGDIVRYEPSTGVYQLPAEHALCLAGRDAHSRGTRGRRRLRHGSRPHAPRRGLPGVDLRRVRLRRGCGGAGPPPSSTQ